MAKKPTSTAVIPWSERLAQQAEIAAGLVARVGGGAGKFVSCKSGMLSYNGAQFPNDQGAFIIVDAILENVFYEGEYDENSPAGPSCFAFGRDTGEMQPHQNSLDAGTAQGNPETGMCAGCPKNEWGSADKGRGKACRNTLRLALIGAGTFDKEDRLVAEEDNDRLAGSELCFMRLPVTSTTAFAAFVKTLASTMQRPTHGVYTRIKLVKDLKTQFKVQFTPEQEIADELMDTVMARHEAAKAVIDFPYEPFEAAPAPAPKAKPVARAAAPVARPVARPAVKPAAKPVQARPVPKPAPVAGPRKKY